MAVFEALLSGRDIDLLRTECAVGKDGYALGQHFDEATSDAVCLLAGFAAVEANFARAENGDERSVSVEDFKIAVARGNFDRIRGLVDEDAIGSNEPDL